MTWRKIIEDYSGRKLSVPGDRLPALAGLARELQTRWNDSYVAGMWRSCLVKHLCWWQSSDSPKRPITDYKSPGWSWVSCEGQVWISELHHEEAEVLDVTVNLVVENLSFGQVRHGKLILRAPVLPGDVEMRLGHCDLDFSPDGIQGVDDHSKFLLLGYSSKMIPIGLIVQPAEDGAFMRIGRVIGWHLKGATPWSSELARREVITII